MTIEQFWAILLKRWQIILICFLAVGLGTFIGSKLMKPQYQSSALVQVAIRSSSNNQSAYNDLQASDQLVQTEATLATGNQVLREVASHYPDLTVIQLTGEVSSTTKLNTQLFEIDVVDPSPARAADLANNIAATLIKQQSQAVQQNNAQAQQQIQQNLDQTSQQIDDITTKISALKAKGGNQGQVALLQAQLSGLQQKYSQLQTALAQLELIQAQNGNTLQLAQPAQPATSPVRPNIPLYTGIGLLVGLLLGLLLAILLERLDTRVRTPEALSQLLEWPALATIWRVGSSKNESIINPKGNSANVEAYRILRTNIGFTGIDKPLRSLVVTSALPNDGKSTVAANLAIFMAKVGKNTLLVDADLRHPTQHEKFGLPVEKMGFSNAVLAFSMPNIPKTPSNHKIHTTTLQPMDALSTTNLSLQPFMHSVEIPNLWVMPSGPLPPNPPELLDSKAMECLSLALANCGAEIVIFDTPPLLGLSDSSILSSKMDGTLVVTDITRVKSGHLKQMKAILAQAGAHVLGYVVNKQRQSGKDSAYSYYSYYRTEDQHIEGNHGMKKGNFPAVPVTPAVVFNSDEPTTLVLQSSPGEQRMNSTDNQRGS